MKSFKMETMKNISLAALLMASALFTACSGSDDDIISEQSATQTAPKVYTLTIEATKGGDEAATRALTLKNHSLKNTWATSDKVYVYNETKKAMLEGYLTPLIEGKNTTTLSGELTGSVEADDLLILFTPSAIMDYTQQDGTLQYISDNCNYSMASTSVTTVASNGAISTNTPGEFKPLQAVVKFTLLDKSGAPINATTLTINALSNNGSCLLQKGPYSNGVYPTLINGPITLTRTSQTDNVFFAAINLMAASNVTYELTATDAEGNIYAYTTTDAPFTVGYFHEVTVKMALKYAKILDISTLTSDYEVTNGQTLTGTLKGNYKITVADDATVNLSDFTIDGVEGEFGEKYPWAGITCNGNATLILEGENYVKGFEEEYPGIYVPVGSTLTIKGTGKLNASSNGFGAGIGGGNNIACGNILIEGGEITATGGSGAAGIGGGAFGGCGNITINGGTIDATGGQAGPGIGAGDDAQCGNITIENKNTVTKVKATAGNLSYYSIGFGATSTGCGTITIGDTQYYDGSAYASEDLRTALKVTPFVYPAE